ncbi:MAG TPA: CBS domain-containing protein [Nitrososphaeraceae archaeon]|nr:CBS domain-containing protein [Nitrososphaeraceae archaeon]
MNSAKNNIGIDSLPVSSAMTVNVISGTESQSVRDICKTMYKNKVGSIIITKVASDTTAEKTPTGIVTERDYIRLIGFSDLFVVDAPISELMSSPIITINQNNSIKDAMEIMLQKDIRRLPVVDTNGKMVGIITDKDIFKAVNKTAELMTGATSQEQFLGEHRGVYERFSEYTFSNIFPHIT